MPNKSVTLRDVYQIVREMKGDFISEITEVKNTMKDLKKTFDDLEAGRLTRLESAFARLEGEREAIKTVARTHATWTAIVVSIIGIMMSAVVAYFIR